MFYPSEYLKRGGIFYLCWVADSWPLRFATITHKQLWSQDIRDLCQALLEVMVVESGMATDRFSLRLSSQILRGIVRLYQRKATVILVDLCMINAHVTKLINKKYCDVPQPPKQRRVRILELPEDEEQVEERIQNSGNAVANIEQITLKEAVITDIVQPNDNFGEENPEQAFQLLNDRTLEVMLAMNDVSAAHHSGLEVQPLETTDKSTDKSRLHANDRAMERISEHDLTFRKSTALGDITMPAEEMDKDIPQIPDILPRHLPVPSPIKEAPVEPRVEENPINVVEDPAKKSDESSQLKELEENYVEPVKRRRPKRLIIDRNIQISSNVIRKRLEIVALELRCQDSSDDIVDPYRLSHETYFRRPAHAGWRLHSQLTPALQFMFQRNLGHRLPTITETDPEVVLADDMTKRKNRTTLQKVLEVTEVPETVPIPEAFRPDLEMLIDPVPVPEELVAGKHRVSNVEPVDIDVSDMPTQVLATASQEDKAKKRQATDYVVSPQKRLRACGFVSFKLSQRLSQEEILKVRDIRQTIIQPAEELVPADVSNKFQDNTVDIAIDPSDLCQLTVLLEQAGLADAQQMPVVPRITVSSVRARRDVRDDSNETPLGSLDRTLVDLGESEATTDSQRIMRTEWGAQGTMLKILQLRQSGVFPLTVRELVELGPKNCSKAMIAARCFNSLMKLKQNNFIKLEKDAESLKITNILFGRRIQKILQLYR